MEGELRQCRLRLSFLLFLFLIIHWSDSTVAKAIHVLHFMLQLINQVGYIIVIARLPGIDGNVNQPCLRAAPSDSVGLLP